MNIHLAALPEPKPESRPVPRVLFLNQVSGPLFRELCEDIARAMGPSILLTAPTFGIARQIASSLTMIEAPGYDRRGLIRRAWSWLRYFLKSCVQAARTGRGTLLFLVSNPPFLPAIGYALNVLRGQPYVVLVYDIYPNLLENLGRIRKGGIIARIWRAFNRRAWGRADIVFTIGEHMARNIAETFSEDPHHAPRIVVIPNWADGDFIRPLPKHENWFCRNHGQVGKLTVLYSGNLGETHDIDTMLDAAGQLKHEERVAFMIIGDGARRNHVEARIAGERLDNVKLLPFQPEEILPYSLTIADVAVIALDKSVEGISVPSKTAYALAAGSAIIAIGCRPNEVADLVDRHQCGTVVEPGDGAAFANAIRRYVTDSELLGRCRRDARLVMEREYSRRNTERYVAALRDILAGKAHSLAAPSTDPVGLQRAAVGDNNR